MTGPTPLPPLPPPNPNPGQPWPGPPIPPPNLGRLDMTPAQILSRAAALIERHGLARGAYRDEYGRLCAYGAIRAACGALDNTDLSDQPRGVWAHVALAAARLGRHLELVGDLPTYGSLQVWSDGRDAGHVVAMMRAAALARPRRPVDSAAPSPAAEAGVPPARIDAGGTHPDSQRQAAAELAGRLAAARAELARVNATRVWVATRWDGIPRHRIALDLGKGGRELTGCGQAMGSGHILPADDPWVLAHTTPCPRCWPTGGA